MPSSTTTVPITLLMTWVTPGTDWLRSYSPTDTVMVSEPVIWEIEMG